MAVSLRSATYTHGCILQRRAFTLGVPSRSQVWEADHVGIVSGRDHDKFASTGWTPVRSKLVDAPYPRELPLVLECRLAQVVEVGLHTQFIGEILDVKADAEVLNAEGLPDILQVDPLIFSTGDRAYFGVGDRIAEAFTARDPADRA